MSPKPPPQSHGRQALAACALLAVAMGFGRFAYTAVYPLMVRDGIVTVETGSIAASANYAGYLAGALAMGWARRSDAAFLCRVGAVATLLCLAVLVPISSPLLLHVARFLAGVASALVLIGASVWLLQVVGYAGGAPLLYGGVGIGIVLSAEMVALGTAYDLHSAEVWLALSILATVLTVAAWPWIKTPPDGAAGFAASEPAVAGPSRGDLRAGTLIVAYGLAGFGYIVTATYLPLIVRSAFAALDPVHLWAAFGLAAAPSAFLWFAACDRLGARRALALNLLCQGIGVVLPVLTHQPWALLLSALLVGGSFLGTVTIAMLAARRAADTVRFNMIAMMTAGYGVGQILGPAVSGVLYRHTQSFDGPLIIAAGALAVGALACVLQRAAGPQTN